jgi:hypothetical protein
MKWRLSISFEMERILVPKMKSISKGDVKKKMMVDVTN